MAYKVFISHSDRDRELSVRVSELVRSMGAQAIDDPLESKDRLASDIPVRIREADEVVLLVTMHSAENPWLHWEIGVASALDKRITSVVEGVDSRNLAPPLGHLQTASGDSMEQLRQGLTERLSSNQGNGKRRDYQPA